MAEGPKPERNFYRVLGVRPDASIDDVRRAFRRQAMLYHPDRNPGDAAADKRFREILKAYQIARRSVERRARASAPKAGPIEAHPVRAHDTSVRRRVRRSRYSVNRILKRFLIFTAFIMGSMLLILYIIWANTQTDWIPGCCWEYFN